MEDKFKIWLFTNKSTYELNISYQLSYGWTVRRSDLVFTWNDLLSTWGWPKTSDWQHKSWRLTPFVWRINVKYIFFVIEKILLYEIRYHISPVTYIYRNFSLRMRSSSDVEAAITDRLLLFRILGEDPNLTIIFVSMILFCSFIHTKM